MLSYFQVYLVLVLVNCFSLLFLKFRWEDTKKDFLILTFHPFVFVQVYILLCALADKDVTFKFSLFKRKIVNRAVLEDLSKEELVTRLLKEQARNKMKKKYG